MNRAKQKLLSIVFASLLLVSCDKKEKEADVQKKPEPPKPAVVSMLSLVPDDTIFFAGGLEPVPLKEALQWTAAHFKLSDELLHPQDMEKLGAEAKSDGQRILLQLWQAYMETAAAPDAQFASWGFAEQPQLVSYAVGLAPVLCRISLSDPEQFKKKLAGLEEKAKVTAAQDGAAGTASFRRYALTAAAATPAVSLIIGVDGKEAVFMLDLGVDSEQTLALAFGQRKPEKSLEQSGRLKALRDKHKLHPSWLGYLDHQQIATGLTTKDGNRMAKMLQLLLPQASKETAKQLADLQNEGCRSDLQEITAKWPQTFGGYTEFDLKAQPARLNSLLVVESTDQPALDSLQSLRGFVPDYIRNAAGPAVFSVALGLNMDNIAPYLTRQWTEFTQKQYKCGFLQEMQAEAKTQNPAAAGMAAGMAAGVRGLSFSLFSMTMDKAAAGGFALPKQLDAAVSLSAKDPMALVRTASALLPQLAALQLSADGTPAQVPAPFPFPLTAAVNGSHLTVYSGSAGEQAAKSLKAAALDSSQGFLAGSMDYSRYYSLLEELLPIEDGKNAELKTAVAAMKQVDLRMMTELDFTSRGIEMTVNVLPASAGSAADPAAAQTRPQQAQP
ncbi:MAG: hypothetical protein ACTFAL_07135 [Candidatus Electronema sp. V4]|uniref:hypothetical protein n=1 Tax=Candidatus Electronema sp. V4 TaxID=3454756 RepID=UPI0040556D9D